MRTLFAVAVVASLAWVPSPARADAPPSLGEVAAREKNKKRGKPITEEDLRARRNGGTVSQPNGAAGSAAAPTANPSPGAAAEKKDGAPAEKPPTEEEAFQAAQKAWQEKLTAAQSDVTNWTGEVARIQAALNDNTGPMYGAGRAARVDSLENAKRQLAAAQTTLENLQEEGRRNRYR